MFYNLQFIFVILEKNKFLNFLVKCLLFFFIFFNKNIYKFYIDNIINLYYIYCDIIFFFYNMNIEIFIKIYCNFIFYFIYVLYMEIFIHSYCDLILFIFYIKKNIYFNIFSFDVYISQELFLTTLIIIIITFYMINIFLNKKNSSIYICIDKFIYKFLIYSTILYGLYFIIINNYDIIGFIYIISCIILQKLLLSLNNKLKTYKTWFIVIWIFNTYLLNKIFMVSNFINFYLLLEGINFSLIILVIMVIHSNDQFKSKTDLLKGIISFFFMNVFLVLILYLIGYICLYMIYPIISINDLIFLDCNIENIIGNEPIYIIGIIFILIYMISKLLFFPFYLYYFNFLMKLPYLFYYYILILSKIPFLFILYKINLQIILYNIQINIIMFILILSVIIAIYNMLLTTNIKEFFLYSSITFISYIMIALINSNFNQLIVKAIVLYIIIYFVLIYILLYILTNIFIDNKNIQNIHILYEYFDNSEKYNNKYILVYKYIFVIIFFILGALAPFFGFFIKIFFFKNLFFFNYFNILNISILILSILNSWPYIKILMYILGFNKKNINNLNIKHDNINPSIILYIMIIIFVLITLLISFL